MKSSTDCDRLECHDPGERDRGLSGLGEHGLADAGAHDAGAHYRDTDEQDDVWYRDTNSYWRRRFFVLAGGLAIVGGVAWGLSALVGPASPAPRASSGSAASVTTSAPSKGSSPSRAATCSPSAIVLSLFTTQPQYGSGQQPQFEVYAVSTAPGSCTLAFGASLVRVVVTRHGQVLWDSSACPARSPTVARPVLFTQSVPRVAALFWNRKAGALGCAGSVPTGTWGTVDAVALADGRSSPVRSFTLER